MGSDVERVLQTVEEAGPITAAERDEISELVEAMEAGFRRPWTELDPVPGIVFTEEGGVIAQEEPGCWYAVRDGMLVAFLTAGEGVEMGQVVKGAVRWESPMLRRLIWLDFGTFLVAAAVAAVLVGVGLGLAVDRLLGAVVGPLVCGGLVGLRNWAVKRHNRQTLAAWPPEQGSSAPGAGRRARDSSIRITEDPR